MSSRSKSRRGWILLGFHCEEVLRFDHYVDQILAHGGSERAALKATVESDGGAPLPP